MLEILEKDAPSLGGYESSGLIFDENGLLKPQFQYLHNSPEVIAVVGPGCVGATTQLGIFLNGLKDQTDMLLLPEFQIMIENPSTGAAMREINELGENHPLYSKMSNKAKWNELYQNVLKGMNEGSFVDDEHIFRIIQHMEETHGDKWRDADIVILDKMIRNAYQATNFPAFFKEKGLEVTGGLILEGSEETSVGRAFIRIQQHFEKKIPVRADDLRAVQRYAAYNEGIKGLVDQFIRFKHCTGSLEKNNFVIDGNGTLTEVKQKLQPVFAYYFDRVIVKKLLEQENVTNDNPMMRRLLTEYKMDKISDRRKTQEQGFPQIIAGENEQSAALRKKHKNDFAKFKTGDYKIPESK